MSNEKLVVGRSGDSLRSAEQLPQAAWRVLMAVGVMLLVVGAVDIALVWYPSRFGLAEFEFASVAASLNSFPVVVMGAGLLAVGGMGVGNRLAIWAGAVATLVALITVLAGAVLFALSLPLALGAEVDALVMTGIKKQAAKTGAQVLTYGLGLMVMTRWTIAAARRSR